MIPRWLLSLTPAIVFGAAFLVLTRFVRRSPSIPREVSLDQALTARAPASLIDLSHAVNVQVWIFVVLALVLALLAMRRFRQALLLLLAEPLAEILNLGLKIAINREMPDQGAVTGLAGLAGLDRLNVLLFPSGHVVRVAVSLGLFFAFVAWPSARLRWPATVLVLAFIALVGVTQTTVGGHLPLDVVGGFLLGAVIVNIVYVVDRQWANRGLPSFRTPAPPPLRTNITSIWPADKRARFTPALTLAGVALVVLFAFHAPQRVWHAASSTPSMSPSSLIHVAADRAAWVDAKIGLLRNKVGPT